MSLEEHIQKIKNFLLGRYKNNLAAILIFGSANTGQYKEGKSDIDHMIFLKRLGRIEIDEELKFLFERLKSESFASQYFHDLKSIQNYIKNRKSFATYITILSKDGSRTVYTTPEFEEFKRRLANHPLSRRDLITHFTERDRFDIDSLFEAANWGLLKKLMSHIRGKLQVLNYLESKDLTFDYQICLRNIKLPNDIKGELRDFYNYYEKRGNISKEQAIYYHNLSKRLTEIIKTEKII